MEKTKYGKQKILSLIEAQNNIPNNYSRNNANYATYQSIEQQSVDTLKEFIFHDFRFDKNSYDELYAFIQKCLNSNSSTLKIVATQALKKIEKTYTPKQEVQISVAEKTNSSLTEATLKMTVEAQKTVPSSYNKKTFNAGMFQLFEEQTINAFQTCLSSQEKYSNGVYALLQQLIHTTENSKNPKIKDLREKVQKKLEKLGKFKKAKQNSAKGDKGNQTPNQKNRIEDDTTMDIIIGSQYGLRNKRVKTEMDEIIKEQTLDLFNDYFQSKTLNENGVKNIKRLITITKLSKDKELQKAASKAEKQLNGQQNTLTPLPQKRNKIINLTQIKNIFRKGKEIVAKSIKKVAVIAGIGLTGLLSVKYGKDIVKAFQTFKSSNTEIVTVPTSQTVKTTKSVSPEMINQAQNQISSQEQNKKQEAAEKAQNITQAPEKTKTETKAETKAQETTSLEKAYKNRFDTALEILIGKEKRDILYNKIDKLAQAGKIKYQEGTTREWYAYAFTIYDKVAPNSPQNKQIKSFLNGENQPAEDINQLVIQAGRNGKGVKGSGTYSSYEKASKELQQQHKNNNRQIWQLQNSAER